MKAGLLSALATLAVLTGGYAFKRQNDSTSGRRAAPPGMGRAAPARIPVRFRDIAAQAGIRFKHHSGAYGGKLMPETMGSGVAFIDYNGDGYQDIFLVNSRDWTDDEVEALRNRKWASREREIASSRKGAERWLLSGGMLRAGKAGSAT